MDIGCQHVALFALIAGGRCTWRQWGSQSPRWEITWGKGQLPPLRLVPDGIFSPTDPRGETGF